MLSEQNNQYLKINAKTWGRDSHGLFDYESNQIKLNSLYIASACKVTRKRNDIKQLPENALTDLEERELCKILTDKGNPKSNH
jgi:hypothetical protein